MRNIILLVLHTYIRVLIHYTRVVNKGEFKASLYIVTSSIGGTKQSLKSSWRLSFSGAVMVRDGDLYYSYGAYITNVLLQCY